MPSMRVVEADESLLPSLSTIVARSFHPVNPYIRRCLPDTNTMRQWWSDLFSHEINNPTCHVFTTVAEGSETAYGILCLRLLKPGDRGAGAWTDEPLTPDHDREAYEPMIADMTEWRERLMFDKMHYLLELFGIDHGCKGTGLGRMLLERACALADEEGHEIFVQANATAKDFYIKSGFEQRAETVMPGERKYTESMLVRCPRKRWKR